MLSSFFPGGCAAPSMPGFRRRHRDLQVQLRPPAAEESAKDGVEVLLDLVVGVEEQLGGLRADFRGDLLQILPRVGEIGELCREEIEAVLDLGELLGGHEIHLAELAHVFPKLGEARRAGRDWAGGRECGSRTPRGPARSAP